ncbi:unnamed protein product [Sphacelaria rigidula]
MVDFVWGAESAHEDSIGLVVLVSTDPPALVTSGADRCVKAWTLDGRPQGLLQQGLAPHAPNPRWSFSVNVNALAEAEAAEAKNVLERMDQNRRDTLLQAQTEEVETLMFPHPSSGGQHNRQQHHHGDEYKHRGSGSFASRRRSRHSDSGATSLPSAEPSPLKQAQLLRQRKGSTNGTGGVVKVEPEGDAETGAAKIGDQESKTGDGAGSGAGSASCSRAVNRALMQAASERTGHSHCDSKSDWTR